MRVWPASVNTTPRPLRWNRRVSSAASSRAICRLTVDWSAPISSAAREMLCVFATQTKQARSSEFIAVVISSRQRSLSVASGLVAERVPGHMLERAHQAGMIPFGAAEHAAHIEQLLARGGIGQAHAELACGGERQVEVLLVQFDAESR